MKFSASREQFMSGLSIAVRGVSTRSAIQTLAGVRLSADGGKLELQATDMELGVRVNAEVAVERDGTVVLPGRLLLDVVRSLPKDELSLEVDLAVGHLLPGRVTVPLWAALDDVADVNVLATHLESLDDHIR